MTKLKEENDLFEDAFYNWCLRHGISLYTRSGEEFSSRNTSTFLADVDMNELKKGIFDLIQFNIEEGKYKVQAIKSMAAITGCSLSDAKAFYDSKHSFSNVESAQ